MREFAERSLMFFTPFCAGLMAGAWLWGPRDAAPTIGRFMVLFLLAAAAVLRLTSKPDMQTNQNDRAPPQVSRAKVYFVLMVALILFTLYAFIVGLGDPVTAARRTQ